MTGAVDPAALLRVYTPEECGPDGYPLAWHRCSACDGSGIRTEYVASRFAGTDYHAHPVSKRCWKCEGAGAIKHLVREQAGHRCVRCGHPYAKGAGEWSPCDEQCTHQGPIRDSQDYIDVVLPESAGWVAGSCPANGQAIEARWRILTVHHLNGNKADCRWWNLAALCQRCHLQIQGKVLLERVYPWPHSDWFKPYAAGWYAHAYLDLDLTREETLERLPALLALELAAGSITPDMLDTGQNES